jgi:hypothetical protein
LLGHTDEFCSSLYANTDDDGTRLWSSDLRALTKRNGSGGSTSKWLREDGGPIRAAAPSHKAGTATSMNATSVPVTGGSTQQQLNVPTVVNQIGAHISMVEAFSNPATLFPQPPAKLTSAAHKPVVNESELIEEELDGSSKKRTRCNNSSSTSADTTNLNGSPETKAMEGVQLSVLQQSTTDKQHFLSAESGSQACRTK